jgi:hypothetical protein
MGEAKNRKLSRHATNDEIFDGAHKPIPTDTASVMTAVMKSLQEFLPGFEITMFLAEKHGKDGQLPRFNYMSTAAREDMYAVLRAWLAKNEAIAHKLDKIDDAPPTESRQ